MNQTNRIKEIMNQITAFCSDVYCHDALLDELLKLQKELIFILFNGIHAELGKLKIWDVERHLCEMNEACNNVAGEELVRVLATCKAICLKIKAEMSGRKGEEKPFGVLAMSDVTMCC